MLCTRCDNEVVPSNPPVWYDSLDMYVCTFCAMDEDETNKEDDEDDDS